jgi:hypothetical protein
MALWCRDLPRATVTRSSVPQLVTLVYPYYENPRFLRRQFERWGSYAPSLREYLRAIIVDDGSPEPAQLPASLPFQVRLFRIEVDIRWNWLAARNIGMHYAAAEGRCFLSDIDHMLPEETIEALVYGVYDPRIVYAFQRREHDGLIIHPHSATFFLSRKTFWKTGGYDEALSGYYGTDGDFRRRLAKVARLELLNDFVERWEYFEDSSTKRYLRKQPQDARVRSLVGSRGLDWRPKTLSFPHHEVHSANCSFCQRGAPCPEKQEVTA